MEQAFSWGPEINKPSDVHPGGDVSHFYWVASGWSPEKVGRWDPPIAGWFTMENPVRWMTIGSMVENPSWITWIHGGNVEISHWIRSKMDDLGLSPRRWKPPEMGGSPMWPHPWNPDRPGWRLRPQGPGVGF